MGDKIIITVCFWLIHGLPEEIKIALHEVSNMWKQTNMCKAFTLVETIQYIWKMRSVDKVVKD